MKKLIHCFLLASSLLFSNLSFCQSSKYGIDILKITPYLRELGRWDDGNVMRVDSNLNFIKFYDNGIRLVLNDDGTMMDLYGTNMRLTGTVNENSETYYNYEGIAKMDDRVIGNFTISFINHQINEFYTGKLRYDGASTFGEEMTQTAVDGLYGYRLLIIFDDTWITLKTEGLINSLFRGSNKVMYRIQINPGRIYKDGKPSRISSF